MKHIRNGEVVGGVVNEASKVTLSGEGGSVETNINNINGDLDDVKAILDNLFDLPNFVNPVTPYSNRISVVEGGFCRQGKKVVVDILIKSNVDMNPGDYWTLGYLNSYYLPNRIVALAIAPTTGIGVYNVRLTNNGEFQIICNSKGLVKDTIYSITGSYYTN